MTSEDKKRRDFINKRVNIGQDRESAAEEYEKTKEQVLSPDLSTLEKKREFFVGKHLVFEEDAPGVSAVKVEIIDVKVKSKLKNTIELVDYNGTPWGFKEEEIIKLSTGDYIADGESKYFIDELQEKEPEENISISKQALSYLAKAQGKTDEEVLEKLEVADMNYVNEIVSEHEDYLFMSANEEGGILIDYKDSSIPITPVEVLKNSPDFKYYALTEDDKIVHGGEYKEDVREFISDRKSLVKLRLVSKRDLKPDANDNSNWVEDSSEKIELRKRIMLWITNEQQELADEFIVSSISGSSKNNEDIEDVSSLTLTKEEDFIKIVTVYGEELLEKANCARKYLMPITEKKLRDEYKKLEMFY